MTYHKYLRGSLVKDTGWVKNASQVTVAICGLTMQEWHDCPEDAHALTDSLADLPPHLICSTCALLLFSKKSP